MTQLSTQMRHRDREMVPRILVQGMFALMAAALGLVTLSVLSGRQHEGVIATSPVAEERIVTLAAQPGGAVAVLGEDGATLARSDDPTGGFLGVIARVVERERMLRGALPETPVSVVRRENGRVAVIDPATGWSVELVGYGPDNIAAFARLLD